MVDGCTSVSRLVGMYRWVLFEDTRLAPGVYLFVSDVLLVFIDLAVGAGCGLSICPLGLSICRWGLAGYYRFAGVGRLGLIVPPPGFIRLSLGVGWALSVFGRSDFCTRVVVRSRMLFSA